MATGDGTVRVQAGVVGAALEDHLARFLTMAREKLLHGPTRLLNDAPEQARDEIEALVQRLYPLHDHDA